MTDAAILGLYTVTPLHCGTGKAADAVDLPVAREIHTRHALIPATSGKGAVRAALERGETPKAELVAWFGAELDFEAADPQPGSIVFTDARLLAFPVRALHTPFCWVTCPLILERLHRDLRAFGLESLWASAGTDLDPGDDDGWQTRRERVQVRETLLSTGALVLEDLAFTREDMAGADAGLQALAAAFGRLLGEREGATRRRLEQDLVVIPDVEFEDLVMRTMPVQARIRLNDRKTTTGDGGNLWYEEVVPPDTLFACFLRHRALGGAKDGGSLADLLTHLRAKRTGRAYLDQPIQIGGNETVGHGICLWHIGGEASDVG